MPVSTTTRGQMISVSTFFFFFLLRLFCLEAEGFSCVALGNSSADRVECRHLKKPSIPHTHTDRRTNWLASFRLHIYAEARA